MGNPDSGGDSFAVLGQLKNVQQVQGNRYAFAATLADGSAVTWVIQSMAATALASRIQT